MKLKKLGGMLKDLAFNTRYARYYYKAPLKEKRILIESKNGGDLAGNMFSILCVLRGAEYKDYEIFLSCTAAKRNHIQGILDRYGITGVTFVKIKSPKYMKVLATAKYLFTDTSFLRSYVKKEGQIITNTWHGTPLKYMGTDVKDRIYAMGNVQRNLLFADFLVYPNDYMKEKMSEAYLLNNLYQGTFLCEGYPRNSCFFDREYGKHIRKELELEGKTVSVYMPTWRGLLTKKTSDQLLLMMDYYLTPLDRMMQDNQVLYVKLHPFVNKSMSFDKYEHIRKFPDGYDTYEFLNICDSLVTDYSSVFYDYANSRNKIILFAYDETRYVKERGIYTPLEELPFPVVKTAEELYHEISTPKNYDDTAFLKRYCTYDAPGAAERICRHVIKGEKVCREEKPQSNGKKNVLIYNASLPKNGITSAMLSLFESVNLDKYNYFFSFAEGAVKKEPLSLMRIPENIGFLPISSDVTPSWMEQISCFLYYRSKRVPKRLERLFRNKLTEKYKNRMYERDFCKHFGSTRLDCVIQYFGYGIKRISLFEAFKGKRIIFVHNNMVEEMKAKKFQNPVSLEDAYRNYDRVAVVTEDIIPSTVEISGRRDNIVQISNCHNFNEVRRKAEEEINLDKPTESNVTKENLEEILASDRLKFITIGRFSAEKGHEMLISAFQRFHEAHPDSVLIIIGGYGPLYRKTLRLARAAKKEGVEIVVIRAMKNPMPVLKKCDFFLLSSFHEGLGLTLLEAVTLGLPVVSTDIPGPKGFMEEHGGRLVPPTEEGIMEGMQAFVDGEIKTLQVDFREYNQNAVGQFEAMLNEVLNESRNHNL